MWSFVIVICLIADLHQCEYIWYGLVDTNMPDS